MYKSILLEKSYIYLIFIELKINLFIYNFITNNNHGHRNYR